jgi:MATE family multidrug resistance protein
MPPLPDSAARAGRRGMSAAPHPGAGAEELPRAGLRHRDVLAIALPIMLSNATTPLVGLVDTIVVGQAGAPHVIGGVAVGAVIFSTLYWVFAFLRMGTTGLTAQAVGAGDTTEVAAALWRAVLVAGLAGAAMIVTQQAIRLASLWAIGGSPDVQQAATAYFDVRIWAAPAGLVNFALIGWFVGLGRASTAFWLQLLLNVTNIGLAVWFVIGRGGGAAAVGAAALIAEWLAAATGLIVAATQLRRWRAAASRATVLHAARLRRMLAMNVDIFVRSACVLTVTFFMTAQGAGTSEATLAANALLLNILHTSIYLLDGFAFAAEALTGRAVGARDKVRFRLAARLSAVWAGATSLVFSLAVWLAGGFLIELATQSEAVRAVARGVLALAAISPAVGVWCFILDGIFIGATRTGDMRNMMLLSLLTFFAAWAILAPSWGNQGLWVSLLVFYAARALTLLACYRRLERHAFG